MSMPPSEPQVVLLSNPIRDALIDMIADQERYRAGTSHRHPDRKARFDKNISALKYCLERL